MPINEQIIMLVNRAKAGDEQSFSQLYNIYYQKIYALALQTVKNAADAEDVLQTTFIKAWQNLAKLQDAAAFNTWIQRIALNEGTTLLRRRNPALSIDATDDDNAPLMQLESELMLPEAYAEQGDLSERLRKIIFSLSDVQRQTITLYYFHGFKLSEIAEVMDCNENTVKSRLYLARKSIKTEIEEQERKTGTKFYGIPLLPFGKIFNDQLLRSAITPSRAAFLYTNIHKAIFAGAAAGVSAGAGVAGVSTGMKVLLGVLAGVVAVGSVVSGYVIAKTISDNSAPPVATVPTEAAATAVTDMTVPSTAAAAAVSGTTEAATETAPPTEPVTEAPEEPETTRPDDASVVFNAIAGKKYLAKGGGYGAASFDVNEDGSFAYIHKEGNTPPATDYGRFTDVVKQNDICYGCTVECDDIYLNGKAARIYTPDASLDDLPDNDAKALISHISIGFGDRAKAEQRLSDPIGYYFIVVDDGGVAYIP